MASNDTSSWGGIAFITKVFKRKGKMMKRYKIRFTETFENDYPREYEECLFPEELDPLELYTRWDELQSKFIKDFSECLLQGWTNQENPKGNFVGSLSIEDWDEDGEYEVIETLATVKLTESAIFYNFNPDTLD